MAARSGFSASRNVAGMDGAQLLHADFGGPVPPEGYQVCNSTRRKYARPETLARLSPAARFILDV
jgi:hypothetical protein